MLAPEMLEGLANIKQHQGFQLNVVHPSLHGTKIKQSTTNVTQLMGVTPAT
jgi:hypothetical protein